MESRQLQIDSEHASKRWWKGDRSEIGEGIDDESLTSRHLIVLKKIDEDEFCRRVLDVLQTDPVLHETASGIAAGLSKLLDCPLHIMKRTPALNAVRTAIIRTLNIQQEERERNGLTQVHSKEDMRRAVEDATSAVAFSVPPNEHQENMARWAAQRRQFADILAANTPSDSKAIPIIDDRSSSWRLDDWIDEVDVSGENDQELVFTDTADQLEAAMEAEAREHQRLLAAQPLDDEAKSCLSPSELADRLKFEIRKLHLLVSTKRDRVHHGVLEEYYQEADLWIQLSRVASSAEVTALRNTLGMPDIERVISRGSGVYVITREEAAQAREKDNRTRAHIQAPRNEVDLTADTRPIRSSASDGTRTSSAFRKARKTPWRPEKVRRSSSEGTRTSRRILQPVSEGSQVDPDAETVRYSVEEERNATSRASRPRPIKGGKRRSETGRIKPGDMQDILARAQVAKGDITTGSGRITPDTLERVQKARIEHRRDSRRQRGRSVPKSG